MPAEQAGCGCASNGQPPCNGQSAKGYRRSIVADFARCTTWCKFVDLCTNPEVCCRSASGFRCRGGRSVRVGSRAADHGWAAVPFRGSPRSRGCERQIVFREGSAHALARSWPPASDGGRLGGRDNLVGPGPATISRSAPFFPVSVGSAGRRCRVARRDVRRRLCLAAKERVLCGVTGHRSASASRPGCAA